MKMNQSQVDATESAESTGFSTIPGGRYRIRLFEVNFKESRAGDPGWNWVWKVVSGPGGDTRYKDRMLFIYTTLLDNMAWKRKEIYDALDFPLDADTDDMLGATAIADVSEKPIPMDRARGGEMSNNVDKLMRDDGDTEADDEEDEDSFLDN